MIDVLTQELGGSPLVQAALRHAVPDAWYPPPSRDGGGVEEYSDAGGREPPCDAPGSRDSPPR